MPLPAPAAHRQDLPMPTRIIDLTEPPLWSWPAERGVTANPLDRVALEPVTLDGPRTTNTGGRPPTHLAWARQIETESSPLHHVGFSKDFTPRTADGSPIAMHQRIAIEACGNPRLAARRPVHAGARRGRPRPSGHGHRRAGEPRTATSTLWSSASTTTGAAPTRGATTGTATT